MIGQRLGCIAWNWNGALEVRIREDGTYILGMLSESMYRGISEFQRKKLIKMLGGKP